MECIEGEQEKAALNGLGWSVRVARESDSEWIAEQRHAVYARELGQLPENPSGRYRDALDARNQYLVLERGGERVGFISLTPPDARPFSVHKYFSESDLAFLNEGRWFEVRILTVNARCRRGLGAMLLMYAAYRWVQAHGGTHVVILGRDALGDLYGSLGFQCAGAETQAGNVRYLLMHSDVRRLTDYVEKQRSMFRKLERLVRWELPLTFRSPAACFHGGRFFEAVGDRFDDLSRRAAIINADVLDAWFPPAPGAMDAVHDHLDWVMRTSPPTGCEGLLSVLSEVRGVPVSCLVPGAGSSDLIFRAFLRWLKPSSRVLLLDPTYGEYAHVLERVVRCRVERIRLSESNGFQAPLAELQCRMHEGFDLVVLVNPNSPTGRYLTPDELEPVLRGVPETTRVWIDETYVEYAGAGASLERFAASTQNVFVCKSMSKVYALSGCRVAYLCGGAPAMEDLRSVTPPWVVGLVSQIAAVRALENPGYYAERYAETHQQRHALARGLRAAGLEVMDGIANFLLCRLPDGGVSASELVRRMAAHGVFIRDVSTMGGALVGRWVRIAVKTECENQRVLYELRRALGVEAEAGMEVASPSSSPRPRAVSVATGAWR
jgi:histidinol-phosphate/aromatic aminotransferase/cobyric acid decarboxylase-like protein